jgi:hypothetical protein
MRLWWLAPTEVIHGTEAGLPTVLAPGPALPAADGDVNAGGCRRTKKARSSAPVRPGVLLPMEC